MLDERFTRALHVEALRRGSLHAEHDPSVLFQASTIGALLDGAYDGDVSFAELAEPKSLHVLRNVLFAAYLAIDEPKSALPQAELVLETGRRD